MLYDTPSDGTVAYGDVPPTITSNISGYREVLYSRYMYLNFIWSEALIKLRYTLYKIKIHSRTVPVRYNHKETAHYIP